MEFFSNLLSALPGAAAQGLIWGLMAIGVFITFRVLDLADLTVDGTMATGGAVCIVMMTNGANVWVALLCAVIAGMLAGLVTGILHTFTTRQGEEKTVRFLSEGDAILCYNTSKHSVKTLTRCVAYYISEDEIEELCATSITFSNLIRQMMEYQFYLKEEMSVNARKLTIRERYLSLLSEIPDILYRVPLKYITYYLGADVTSLGYLAGSCK